MAPRNSFRQTRTKMRIEGPSAYDAILKALAAIRSRIVAWVCSAVVCLGLSNLNAQFCDPCDFDGNGVVGIEDFYLLDAAVKSGEYDPTFEVAGRVGIVNSTDRNAFIEFQLKARIGDSNWDGVFDSLDIIQVSQVGEYEDNDGRNPATISNSSWATGDWDGDGDYTSHDFVYSFNSGGYHSEPLRPDSYPDLPDARQPSTSGATPFSPATSSKMPNAVTVIYHPVNGNLSIESDSVVTSLEIRSSMPIFTGEYIGKNGLFDVVPQMHFCATCVSNEKFFLFDPYGIAADFGPVVQIGQTHEQLLEYFVANGSVQPRGDLTASGGGGPFLWVVDGDFDVDGHYTALDIDALSRAVIEDRVNTKFDLNSDAQVDQTDRKLWVEQFANTFFGDSNLDREFNSTDLIAVFQSGHYEDGSHMNSGWADGDWNGDLDFNSSDLVLAFQFGGYERGPRVATHTVPEPAAIVMIIGFVRFAMRRRRPTAE